MCRRRLREPGRLGARRRDALVDAAALRRLRHLARGDGDQRRSPPAIDLELDRRMDIVARARRDASTARRMAAEVETMIQALRHGLVDAGGLRLADALQLGGVIPAAVTAAAIAGCPLFGPTFTTNQRVDHLPVAANSGRDRALDRARRSRATPTSGPAAGRAARSASRTRSSSAHDEALEGALRLRRRERPRCATRSRRSVKIEGGGDRHALLVDRSQLPALRAVRAAARERRAGPPARARPGTCVASRRARAAGRRPTPPACRSCRCSRAPGKGPIKHALRVTVSETAPRVRLARAALRVRLAATRRCRGWASGCGCKKSVDISRFPRQARRVAQAMKTYGLIVADNGSDWFVSGVPEPRAGTTTSYTRLDVLSGTRLRGRRREPGCPAGSTQRDLRAQAGEPSSCTQVAHERAVLPERHAGTGLNVSMFVVSP